MTNVNTIKCAYIINQIINSTNPHIKGVGFHFPLLGLHELTRQYFSLPNEIKFLAGPQIVESIKNHISKSKITSYVNDGIIIDKNIKEFSVNLSFIKEIGSELSLQRLHNTLYSEDFFKGIIRTLKKLLKDENYDLKMCYKLFDELLLLLIEYLFIRGHSKESLYAKFNNIISQNQKNSYDAAIKILDHLMTIGTKPLSSMEKLDVKIIINKQKSFSNYRFLHSFIERHLTDLFKENRISKYVKSDTYFNTEYHFIIYKIDKEYVDKTLAKFLEAYDLLKHRFDFPENHLILYLENKVFTVPNPKEDSKIKVKYFERFLLECNFIDLSDMMNLEILKALEWTSFPEKTTDKKYAFMSLWSIMEFLLIDSVDDNKIDTICKNFIPYMSLFHYRKSIKLFFKDIIYQMNMDLKEAAKKIENFLDIKLSSIDVDISTLSLADKFTIFLFTKKIPIDKKWNDFNVGNISEDYLIARTIPLINDVDKEIDQFEVMLKNDIKQIYRLRNMLTHSGLNDDKMLTNTFYRLKYYVQTLLNAISYSWKFNSNITSLSELHNLKRFDAIQYKTFIKTLNKGNDETRWINLTDFKGALVSYPKSSFSFIEKTSRKN